MLEDAGSVESRKSKGRMHQPVPAQMSHRHHATTVALTSLHAVDVALLVAAHPHHTLQQDYIRQRDRDSQVQESTSQQCN